MPGPEPKTVFVTSDSESEVNTTANRMNTVASACTVQSGQVNNPMGARRTVQDFQKALSDKKDRLTKTEVLAIKAMENVNVGDDFSLEDVMTAIKEFDSLRGQMATDMSQMKKLLGIMTLVFILLTGTIFGLMWATVELTKDYRPEDSGVLKTPDGHLVGTSSSAYTLPISSLASASRGELRSLSSVDIKGTNSWTSHKVASVSKIPAGSVVIKTQANRTIVVESDGAVYLDGTASTGGRRLDSATDTTATILSDTTTDTASESFGEPSPCVIINEVVSDPVSGTKEYVELHNRCKTDVDLCTADPCQWGVVEEADNKKSIREKGNFEPKTIAAGGYAVVTGMKALNNPGDTVYLYKNSCATGDDGCGLVDTFQYFNNNAGKGKSWTRLAHIDGSFTWGVEETTRGTANPVPAERGDGKYTFGGDTPEPCGGGCGGICFGTFNIQNLGVTKQSRPAVMSAILGVLNRYDVVVIQELSQMPNAEGGVCGENTESVICELVPDGYDIAASPRIGDEQYVVMWKTSAATLVEGSSTHPDPYTSDSTYPDPAGKHSRPPHAWQLQIADSVPWDLVLSTTHTAPHQATQEILNFPQVLAWMQSKFPGANRLIAGDFNAGGSYFKDEKGTTANPAQWPGSILNDEFQGYQLLTPNENFDTTVALGNAYAYDRIIVNTDLAEHAGKAQVLKLDEHVDLTALVAEGCASGYIKEADCNANDQNNANTVQEFARKVSDHHAVEVCLRAPEP